MIYIDCDGVLADFSKAVLQHTGKEYCKESWRVLEEVPWLFCYLDVLPDAHDAVQQIISRYGYHRVQVLTALPKITGKLYTVQRDKVEWVHDCIDNELQVNCVSNWRDKKNFCYNAKDILIDDSERNCLEWTAVGGKAIQHVNWEKTLKELHTFME